MENKYKLHGEEYEPIGTWTRLEGQKLEPFLESGAIALIDASWLVQLAATAGATISRRQELPPNAFLSMEEIKSATCEGDFVGFHIIALSYMWLHPSHPDPQGTTLQELAGMLASYLENGFPVWGVLWDYASLYQHPDPLLGIYRTAKEEALFRQALEGLAVFFGHPHTHVFKVTLHPIGYPASYNLPSNANCALYNDRGWPFTESSLSGLSKDSFKTRDLSQKNPSENGNRIGGRVPPLLPSEFEVEIKQRSFLNQRVDLPLVTRLYRQYFLQTFREVELLDYSCLNWNDQQIDQVAHMLSAGYLPNLSFLDLSANAFGVEACHSLAQAILARKSPLLRKVHLFANSRIGDKGMEVLSDALVSLESIDLARCGISSAGCYALAEASRRNPSACRLRYVQLRENRIGYEGCEALQKVCIYHRSTLQRVDLDDQTASSAAMMDKLKPLINNLEYVDILE